MNDEVNALTYEINDLKEQLKTLRREKSNLQMAVHLINQISQVVGVKNIVDHILQILVSAVGGSNIAIYYTVDDRWRYEDVLGRKEWLDSIEDDTVRKSVEQKKFIKIKESEKSKLTIPGFPRTYETWVYPLQFHDFFFGAVRLQGMAIEHAHYRENIDPFITYSSLILYHEVSSLKKLRSAYNKVSKAKEDLQKIKEQFELAMKFANDGLFDWDLQSNEIFYSPVWKSILGYEDNEIKNEFSEWERLTKPEDVKASWAMLTEVLEGKRDRFQKEFQMKHKDGHWVDILSRAKVVFNEKGEGLRVVGTHVDITKLKKIENSLRDSEEKFSKAFYNAPMLMTISSIKDGRYIEVNDAFINHTGYKRENTIGFTSIEIGFISAAERQSIINELENNGRVHNLELKLRNADGSNFICLYSGEIIEVEREPRLLSIALDITDQRKMENHLQQAQKMEAIGTLAGGVAHDFNNMLSVIIGHADIALEDTDPSLPIHDKLEEIRKAGVRSADLTRQLLAFARKQTVSPKVLDLNNTISGMIKMLQRLIGEDIDLLWKPDQDIWPVKMDPSQIDQIIANLCVNARDAISDVGKITIETGNTQFGETYCANHPGFLPGEFVLLAVSDNGCGINTDALDKIFDPFFTTKRPGRGTGLGLATVYGVVKQNNGFVNVYSEPGQGTTFKIYLKRYQTKKDFLSKQGEDLIIEHGHETILLVEDESAILKMTQMMLERQGYKVIAAETPGEAIRIAQEHIGEIHLLMTDVIMPEMNGRDLAKNILSFYPGLKRLFMSGYTANVIAHHGVLDKGINFIQKPFSRKQLSAKVREALGGDEV